MTKEADKAGGAEFFSAYSQEILRHSGQHGLPLFFSGGSALAGVSRLLARSLIPSVHIITPFDSGGSSAKLRQAFNMPAVGDIRNRLLCLAQVEVVGKALPELCAMRFDVSDSASALKAELKDLAVGEHAAMRRLSSDAREQVQLNFASVMAALPASFDLRGASVGNLLLTGAYLRHGRDFNAAVQDFSHLLEIVGEVRPIVDQSLHLCARLEDNSLVLGQHLITGKEVPALGQPIKEIFLTKAQPCADGQAGAAVPDENRDWAVALPTPARVYLDRVVLKHIVAAPLICFPMGSFYSSVVANLLPEGVGRAISQARCPKVYVPGAGEDPEAQGLSVAERVLVLLRTLRKDAGANVPVHHLISHVFIDKDLHYPAGVEAEKLKKMNIAVAEVQLLDRRFSKDSYSPQYFLEALAELVAIEA